MQARLLYVKQSSCVTQDKTIELALTEITLNGTLFQPAAQKKKGEKNANFLFREVAGALITFLVCTQFLQGISPITRVLSHLAGNGFPSLLKCRLEILANLAPHPVYFLSLSSFVFCLLLSIVFLNGS